MDALLSHRYTRVALGHVVEQDEHLPTLRVKDFLKGRRMSDNPLVCVLPTRNAVENCYWEKREKQEKRENHITVSFDP